MDRLASRKLWVVVLGMLLATWLRSRGLMALSGRREAQP